MNHAGSKGHVTPAPALGVGKARHRSDANYAKSYGRSSYESHKAKQPSQPSSPTPSSPSTAQEPLKRVHSNAPFNSAAVAHHHVQHQHQRSLTTTTAAAVTMVLADPLATSPLSSPRSSCEDGDVDVSPMTTPSQSYVPEHRRRRGGAGEGGVPTRSGMPAPVARHVDPLEGPATTAASGCRDDAATGAHGRSSPGKENTLAGPLAVPACGGGAAAGSGARRAAVPRTVSPAARPSPPRGALGANQRRTPSGGLHQRPHSATTATDAAGLAGVTATAPDRVGLAAGSRAPIKRTSSAKARPVTATLRKQPLHDPSAGPAPQGPSAASAAPAPAASRALTPPQAQHDVQPDSPPPRRRSPVEEEMSPAARHQLEQAQSVLDYVAEVAAALEQRRRCAAPPRSTENFRASVVPYRRRANRNGHARDASVSPDPHAPDAPTAPEPSNRGGGDSVALLPDMHHAASRLLSAFTKLEYAQLGEDVDVPLLEREAAEHSAQLLRHTDAVQRQLSLHEAAAVRQVVAERRDVFQSMHQLVHFMASMTHEVALLREAALRRDFEQAREVWCAFKVAVDLPATAVGPARLFSPAGMVAHSPFFIWVADRWLPAMREWRALVREVRESAAATGDVEAAVRRARQASLRIDGLHEILRSGETITALLRDDVVAPLEELARTLAQRRAVFAELQTVMDSEAVTEGTLKAAQLVPVVKAAQAAWRARSSGNRSSTGPSCPSAEDEESGQRLRRAEAFLAQLHEADALLRTATATLQLPAPELASLLEHITRGNELLASWGAANDDAAAHNAATVGRAALESFKLLRPSGRLSDNGSSCVSSPRPEQTSTPASPGGACVTPIRASANSSACAGAAPAGGIGLPPLNSGLWIGDALPAGFSARSLYVAHRPGGAWSPELSMAYMELCEVFAMLFTQRQARRELETALQPRPSADEHGTGLSASAQATPRRPVWEGPSGTAAAAAPSPAESWRTGDDSHAYGHGRSVGSSPARTTRTSDGSVQGPSADELRRRIQQAEDAGVGGPLIEEARARLRRLDTLRLKIHFDAQTRVLPIPDAAQAVFAEVYDQIHDFCQAQLTPQQPQQQQQTLPSPSSPHHRSGAAERRLRIRYEDADGDFISLLDQQDWCMMLSELAPHGCGGVKVELFCDYQVMPGPMTNTDSLSINEVEGSAGLPRPPLTAPAAANQYGAEGTSELESADFRTEGTPDPARPAATRASPPAAGAEKRPNVFDRLASAAKISGTANGVGSGPARKPPPRLHPHTLRPTSPQRAPLVPPRGRNAAAAGGARCVSPQKTSAAAGAAASGQPLQPPRRQGNGAGARSKDSPPSTAAAASAGPQTAALTAENLRRNAAGAPAKPRRSGGRSSSGEQPGGGRAGAGAKAAADASVAQLPEAPAPSDVARAERVAEMAQDPVDGPLRASSTVHIDLEAARRWEMPGDEDELTLMEIGTRASMSTVRHERSVPGSEYAPSAVMRPTEMLPRPAAAAAAGPESGKPPRNTFTTTHCSAKVDGTALPGAVRRETGPSAPALQAVSSGSGSDDFAAAAPRVDATAAPRARPAGSPTRGPRRWSSDVFNLDDVETVCSDRSRVQRAAPEPKGHATLPPRPVSTANASPPNASPPGGRTPQRLRRGARGTPTRQRNVDGGEAHAEGDADDDGGAEVLAEMQRMREANSRAMAQRKPSWH